MNEKKTFAVISVGYSIFIGFLLKPRKKHLTSTVDSVKFAFFVAGVAQLVERNLAKVEVASSRLVSRSRVLAR